MKDLQNFLKLNNIKRFKRNYTMFERLTMNMYRGLYPKLKNFLLNYDIKNSWTGVYISFLDTFYYHNDDILLLYQLDLIKILYQIMLRELDPDFFEQLITEGKLSLNINQTLIIEDSEVKVNSWEFDWKGLYLLYKSFTDDMQGFTLELNPNYISDMITNLFNNILLSSNFKTIFNLLIEKESFFDEFLLLIIPYDYKLELLEEPLTNNKIWLFKLIVEYSDEQLYDIVTEKFEEYSELLNQSDKGKKLLEWINQKYTQL
jgi:succinate dehydrogenase flavin-adding protein (antitoxin of CptAB toxin-antitoxin module)